MVKKNITKKGKLAAEKKKRKALLARLKLLKLKAAKKTIRQKQKQNQRQEVTVNNIINTVSKSTRRRKSYRREEKLEDKLKDKPTPAVFTSLANRYSTNTDNTKNDLDKAKLLALENKIKELEALRSVAPDIGASKESTEKVEKQIEKNEEDIINLETQKEKEMITVKAKEEKDKITERLSRFAQNKKVQEQEFKLENSSREQLEKQLEKVERKSKDLEEEYDAVEKEIEDISRTIKGREEFLKSESAKQMDEQEELKFIGDLNKLIDQRDELMKEFDKIASTLAPLRKERTLIEQNLNGKIQKAKKELKEAEEAEKQFEEEKKKAEEAIKKIEEDKKARLDALEQGKKKRLDALKAGELTRSAKKDDEVKYYSDKVESYQDMTLEELQEELDTLEPFIPKKASGKFSGRHNKHVKLLKDMIQLAELERQKQEREKRKAEGLKARTKARGRAIKTPKGGAASPLVQFSESEQTGGAGGGAAGPKSSDVD